MRNWQPATWTAGLYFQDTDEWCLDGWQVESGLANKLDTCTDVAIYSATHMKLVALIEVDAMIERMMRQGE